MKKAAVILIGLLVLLLCSCTEKEQNNMETVCSQTVTFINGVQDADVWILPETEQNLKTTVWGTATAAKVKTGESRQAPLCEPGDDGLYILRMIDTDGFFYSAGGMTLKENWALRIEADGLNVNASVTDENGALQNTYEVFAARL